MKHLFIFLLLLPLIGFNVDKPVKTKITDGITVSLPTELKPMTADDIAQRYPSVRAPLGAFTTDERTIDFSVNTSATQWPATKDREDNIEMASKFFKAGIYNLYDRVEMVNEGIHEVHKKKFIFFEFESRVGASKMKAGHQDAVVTYTYIQYLVEPGRTLVFSFNCPGEHRQEWQEKASAIMNSIRMK